MVSGKARTLLGAIHAGGVYVNFVGTEIQALLVATVTLLVVPKGIVVGGTGHTKVAAVGRFKAKKSLLEAPRRPI
jgi:hypothetical protein